MILYKVYGTTGEYDMYDEWDIKAFNLESSANELCEKLNQIAKSNATDKEKERLRKELNDKKDIYGYKNTDYYVSELEVEIL